MRVNGQPERWLIAARLSYMTKKDRARGDDLINGIQTQDRRASDWAQQEGHVIVHVARDERIRGGSSVGASGVGPWLTDPVKLVQYDGIVAYDVSRLSREHSDLAWLRKWAEHNHKKLYVIKERLRWPDNGDGTLWGVAVERAYQERQEIAERITREFAALEQAGRLIGRPPFGYISAGDKYDRYLAPTDDGRNYVPLIYQHYTEGWSLEKIAKWLNSEGVKPVSGVWWARSIGGLIRNPVYKGHRCKQEVVPPDEVEECDGKVVRYRYGNAWVETPQLRYGRVIHRCEPMVDTVIWKNANEALAASRKRGYVTDPKNRAMLAEALLCPFCEDSPMYRHRATSRGRAYFYYRCSGRGSERRSCGNMVRVELVDAAVNEIMSNTFNVRVLRHEVTYGNEAEIKAELERIKDKLEQLTAQELDWGKEDCERARLRTEYEHVASTRLVEDSVELVEINDTYLELWELQSVHERGPWLVEHGFRVTASRERVTISQGAVSAAVSLNEPKRLAIIRDTEPVYQGKCGCGCDIDVYGSKYGPQKKYVNESHASRFYYRRRATDRDR